MDDLELSRDEATVLMEQMRGIGQRLGDESLNQITSILARLSADLMFQRPAGFFRRAVPIVLRVSPSQAEILLRAIEDNDGLKDPSRRDPARSNLRDTPWQELKRFPALSLMKKLAHRVSR